MRRTRRIARGGVGLLLLLGLAGSVRAADAPPVGPAADGFVRLAPDVGGGVSGLAVLDAGVLWGTAANDPGDDGPFEGALTVLGVVADDGKTVSFRPSTALVPLMRFARKAEAVVLVPGAAGGLLLGTDDERLGGWLRWR